MGDLTRPPATAGLPVPAAGRDALERARLAAEEYAKAADAPATIGAYGSDLEHFRAWCELTGRSAMPAEPETVALYIASMGPVYSTRTIRRRLAAIARDHREQQHQLDTKHPTIRNVWRGIRKTHGRRPRRKDPLVTKLLARLVAKLGPNLWDLRDRAIVLVGFAGALRRSEVSGIDVAHIKFSDAGMTIALPRSKTDQDGEGEDIGIPYGRAEATCPVRAVQAWMQAANITDGPVFRPINRWGDVELSRLTDRSIAEVVKKLARRAGMSPEKVKRLGGHSLRAGFITEAVDRGIPDREARRHSRHRSPQSFEEYVRSLRALKDSPAGKVGL